MQNTAPAVIQNALPFGNGKRPWNIPRSRFTIFGESISGGQHGPEIQSAAVRFVIGICAQVRVSITIVGAVCAKHSQFQFVTDSGTGRKA